MPVVVLSCGRTVLGSHMISKGAWLQAEGHLGSGLPFTCGIFSTDECTQLADTFPGYIKKMSQCQESFASVFKRYELKTALIFRKSVEAVIQPNEGCPAELG